MAEHAQIETQAETITRYQRDNDHLTKRVNDLVRIHEKSCDYIIKQKRTIAALEAQLTPEAKADWIFQNDQ